MSLLRPKPLVGCRRLIDKVRARKVGICLRQDVAKNLFAFRKNTWVSWICSWKVPMSTGMLACLWKERRCKIYQYVYGVQKKYGEPGQHDIQVYNVHMHTYNIVYLCMYIYIYCICIQNLIYIYIYNMIWSLIIHTFMNMCFPTRPTRRAAIPMT